MQFSKWHGLGNDYLLVERAELAWPLTPERVQRICDYHFGVGSDGIVEVASANGDRAEVVIWNPDGSTAELSGNGTRIAARWLARRSGADDGSHRGRPARGRRRRCAAASRSRWTMGPVEVGEPETIDVGGEAVEFVPVSVGNPHAVIRREPEREELLRLGPLVESHERFPERTNVQLVRVDGPERRDGRRLGARGGGDALLGHERRRGRGAAVAHGWCESPVTVHLAGGDLARRRSTSDCTRASSGPPKRSAASSSRRSSSCEVRKRLDAVPPYLFAELERKIERAREGRHRRDQPRASAIPTCRRPRR